MWGSWATQRSPAEPTQGPSSCRSTETQSVGQSHRARLLSCMWACRAQAVWAQPRAQGYSHGGVRYGDITHGMQRSMFRKITPNSLL